MAARVLSEPAQHSMRPTPHPASRGAPGATSVRSRIRWTPSGAPDGHPPLRKTDLCDSTTECTATARHNTNYAAWTSSTTDRPTDRTLAWFYTQLNMLSLGSRAKGIPPVIIRNAHTHGSGNQSHETHARQRTKRAFLKSSCGLPNLSAFCDLAARSLLRYPHECFAAAFFS